MLQAPRAREFSSQVERSSSKSGSLKRRVETLFFLFLFCEGGKGERAKQGEAKEISCMMH
jgi:hypothetical protein